MAYFRVLFLEPGGLPGFFAVATFGAATSTGAGMEKAALDCSSAAFAA
jgi:hypothetical protein